MSECIRCGACCKVLPCLTKGMSTETRQWLIARGATETEDKIYLLLPHICPQLIVCGQHVLTRCDKEVSIEPWYGCALHDSPDYPVACARYHGHGHYYKPPGCGYLK